MFGLFNAPRGYPQFFCNSTGGLAPEAKAGFCAIGMPAVADVVQVAMDEFGKPVPYEKDEREKVLGEYEESFDFEDEDAQFYELADTDQFFRKLPKFVPFADAYAASNLKP